MNQVANFCWAWTDKWIISTKDGKFYVWSDPDYNGGDNTIRPWNGTFDKFVRKYAGDCVRDKGNRIIVNMCAGATFVRQPENVV